MALETDIFTKNENEEEDLGCYFLQPTSSPYNIAEKVQQANLDLSKINVEKRTTARVKFKDELVSFEPDLTDDDVNSIESDHVVDSPTNQVPPNQTLTNENARFAANQQAEIQKSPNEMTAVKVMAYEKAVSDILETVELNVDILDEIEEIPEDFEIEFCEYKTSLREEFIHILDSKTQISEEDAIYFEEDLTESRKNDSESTSTDSKPTSKTSKTASSQDISAQKDITHRVSTPKKPSKRQGIRKDLRASEIRCRDHCIEKIDHGLSMSIKKLEIHEKTPINLPPLQLHQRNCCDNLKYSSTSRNLPNYNGYRSEYGLTIRQLKKRDRHVKMIRQKEMARQKLIEEYRRLKVQQNEEVFCQWLKEIANRRRQGFNKDSRSTSSNSGAASKILTSPKIVNLPNNAENISKTVKTRPKTAGCNDFIPKTGVKKKKRPHTTQSCVYIEVPREMLQQGLQIGDFLVTNSKIMTKKLHILTVS